MADQLTPEQRERAAELLQTHAGKTAKPQKETNQDFKKIVVWCLMTACVVFTATDQYHKANPTIIEKIVEVDKTRIIYEDKENSLRETIKRIANF